MSRSLAFSVAATGLLLSGTAAAVFSLDYTAGDVFKDVELTSNDAGSLAYILGPTGIPLPSDAYVSTVDSNYLAPLGFDGTAEALFTPENSGNTDLGLAADAQAIVEAVMKQVDAGNVTDDNPLWLFGYSQSSAALALVAQELHAQGISPEDLHFVLVGDSASAHGGFLNSFMDSLPPWLQEWVEPLLGDFGLKDSMGLTTPDYYPTDVYTISDDGYANWPDNIFDFSAVSNAINGMFSSHIEYLGLTPEQIADATKIATDGLANYYTIDAGDINDWDAIVNAGVNTGSLPDWLGDLLTGSW